MKYILSLLLLFNFVAIADDGLLQEINGNEFEADLVAPGVTSTFIVELKNNNMYEDAINISAILPSGDYEFLGGAYPGLGGDCSNSLASNQSCKIAIEYSPLSSGDKDDFITFNYDLITTTLGSSHSTQIKIDGHSDLTTISGCSALSPVITTFSPVIVPPSASNTISVFGHNFSAATQISIDGHTVSNINVINPMHLTFSITTSAQTGFEDAEIKNECGQSIKANALAIQSSDWIDLRDSNAVSFADPVYVASGVSGYSVDPNYGFQVNVTSQSWANMLKFSGVCGSVDNDFDIVIYKTANTKATMFSLWNEDLNPNPFPGTQSYNTQYTGFWFSGSATSSMWGGQLNDGGSSWNQSFTSVSISTGKYYKLTFKNAGQSGNVMEIWEVDSTFNNISLLRSFTSNKVASPATRVCPGLTPYTSGNADYYVTGIRVY